VLPSHDETGYPAPHGAPDRTAGSERADAAGPESPSRQADRVAAVETALQQLSGQPLEEHAAGYERLHAELQAALAEIDGA
jgi:hypothetical protein